MVMKYCTIEPEVSGELGERTILDSSVNPPLIQKLHFIFLGWLGDDLIECFPVYLIGERLKKYLENSVFTGFTIDTCEISISDDFYLLQPNVVIPNFFWLKINKEKEDDFFINENNLLSIKEDAFVKIANLFCFKNALITCNS